METCLERPPIEANVIRDGETIITGDSCGEWGVLFATLEDLVFVAAESSWVISTIVLSTIL